MRRNRDKAQASTTPEENSRPLRGFSLRNILIAVLLCGVAVAVFLPRGAAATLCGKLVGVLLPEGAGIVIAQNSAESPTGTTSPGSTDAKGQYRYTNRLSREKSPYLLLHAHNPVDWYPWGEEAFAKAKSENKPIFLSVGYYTCHWCHVMERESYSNESIAAILNRDYVAIKVDREERPDVDSTYMDFLQASTGSGGWPMNVFLTPDLKPFFGGTYFPPHDQNGRSGLDTLLRRIAELWRDRRQDILQSASQATEQLQQMMKQEAGSGGALRADVLDKTYAQIREGYDSKNGGFGAAPKFPRPVTLEFLLRYWKRTGTKDALDMVLQTLHTMAAGGIHDQLDGGFHRYSTDEFWRVPHFEKMLYDQAQLASVYMEAYQITQDLFYADVAHDILEFVLRDLRSPEGGFYSALDADSQLQGKPEQGEGLFYVWRSAEIESILGKEIGALFNFRYGVSPDGNVPAAQDIEGWLKGKNVLYEQHSVAETAQKFGKNEAETLTLLNSARQKLYAARSLRPHPPTDSKLITVWNGMMISTLARGSQILNEPRYLDTARRASSFVRVKLYQPSTGHLKRRFREGSAAIDGYLDDYTSMIQGLLDLYEASFDVRALSWAIQLQQTQDHLFLDEKQGGYFTTTGKDSHIILRTREAYDGVEPSPSSVAVMNLLRLWQITDQKAWKAEADKSLSVFGQRLERSPGAMPFMMAALDFNLSPHKQIVIAGAPGADDTQALLRLVWQRYIPNRVLLLADGAEGQKQLAQWLPPLASMTRRQGRATAYICENYICNLPTSDPKVAASLLDGHAPTRQ